MYLFSPEKGPEEYTFLSTPVCLTVNGKQYAVLASNGHEETGLLIYACGHRIIFLQAEETQVLSTYLRMQKKGKPFFRLIISLIAGRLSWARL